MSGLFRLTLKKQKKLQRWFSSFAIFSLLLQIFSGVFAYQPVWAVDLKSEITFDKGKNSFNISVNTPNEVNYLLAYQTNLQIESFSGTAKTDGNSFSREIYAGIKSGDGFRKDEVIRGIYRVKVDSQNFFDAKRFIFENGSLKTLAVDLTAKSLEISLGDTNWLKTGFDEIEQVCSDTAISNTTNEDWKINSEEGWAQTKEGVKLGVKYLFPQENNVTVTFKCLPKNVVAPLKIQKVKVSDLNLPEGINPYGEYAYDITTTLQDGTFEYDVTLPKPEGQTAEVSYIEKSIEELNITEVKTEEVKQIEENKVGQEGDQIKASGIDHFTIFIVSSKFTGSDASITVLLNGGEKIKVNQPGANIEVSITVGVNNKRGSNYNWRGTSWRLGNSGNYTCVNTPDHSNNNWSTTEYTEKFNITAQGDYSIKDLTIRIHDRDNCSDDADNSLTISGAVTVEQIIINPSLSQSCGLDIALVLDNSTSIDPTELGQMKTAMNAFVSALAGTPTQFSVTKFATTALIIQAFTSNSGSVTTAINGIPVGGGFTNWEDGLTKAQSTLPNRTNPNLVIFASDGNPNTVIGGSGGSASESTAVSAAQVVANALKASGTRILAIGIGTDLNVTNMEAISGSNVNTGNVLTSDVITTDFSGLATQLATFATQTCGGTITVNKYIDSVSPTTRGGVGWQFNIAGTSKTTDGNGQTEAVNVSAGSNYSVTETNMLSGHSFGSASCKKSNGDSVGTPNGQGVTGITVGASDIISCDFVNTLNKGTITIIKDAVPNDPQDFKFTGNLGQFDLDDDSDPTLPNIATFSGMTQGTYTVTEPNVQGWDLTNVVCNDTNSQGNVNNRNAVIQLEPGETVTCTFTNTKQTGTLTLVKTVTNDNGGQKTTADFQAYINGNPVPWNVPQTLNAGSYTATESSQSGYAASSWGGGCSANGTVSLTGGENKTCTITNNDIQPLLTVTKVVNGGSKQIGDFPLFIDENPVSSGQQTGINVGQHVVSETNQLHYTGAISGDCASDGSITLSLGDVKSCTITNTYVPYCGDGNKDLGEACDDGNQVNTDTCLNTCVAAACGDGYIQTGVDECDDGNKVNHDSCSTSCKTEYPITFEKKVIGGSSQPSDWSFNVSGYGTVHDGETVYFVPGYYPVTESGPEHYSLEGTSGSCHDSSGNIELAVSNSDPNFCRITNVYEPYCGDGNIDLGEQCDGTKGVTPGQNFCTNTCKLIPIYSGGNSCSQGKTPVLIQGPVEIKATNPDGPNLITITLPGVNEYLFEAIGDYGYGGDYPNNTINRADAGYATGDAWATRRDNLLGISASAQYRGITSLLSDMGTGNMGIVNWGNYDLSHNYKVSYTPASISDTNVRFVISDWYDTWYSGDSASDTNKNQGGMHDNAGSLNLNVYECQDYGKISGYKWNDINGDGVWDEGEPVVNRSDVVNGVTIFLDLNNNGQQEGGEPTTTTDNNGYYEFTNVVPGRYTVCERDDNMVGWLRTYPANNSCHGIFIDPSEDETDVNFGNFRNGQITACKYDDYNGNGRKDGNEPGLANISMELQKKFNNDNERAFDQWNPNVILGETDESGCYTFDNLGPGVYRTREILTDADLAGYFPTDDWITDGDYRVSNEILMASNNSFTVNYLNDLNPISLTLNKTHNKVGSTAVRGETLTFTLTVENTADSTAYNVNVRDVLPVGFNYVLGTARVDGNLSEPTISGQQLTWNVGNMGPNQKIVVTYNVKVSDSQNEGGYPNVAVAFGTNRPSSSEDNSTSYSNFAFVYTAVGIGISYSVSIGGGAVLGVATGPEEGQVLGAATGSSTFVLIMAILMILGGLLIYRKGKKLHV